jgi:ABC-type antimicrobial peptide transport system ATPase subunit
MILLAAARRAERAAERQPLKSSERTLRANRWWSAMLMKKHEIVRVLRNAGLEDAAEEAERSLPDEVDSERAAEFGLRHGITRDELISRMGGSP